MSLLTDSLPGRIAIALCLAGVILLGLHAWRVGQSDWHVATMALDLDVENSFERTLTLPRAGAYELQIEASRRVPDDITRSALEVLDQPSPVALEWRVESGGETIARGDARDYLFVERGPRSLPGKLRRVLLRVPAGQDEVRWRTLGLAGHWTVARGIGRFKVAAPGDIRLAVQVTAPWSPLMPAAPRLVLRHERRLWDENYERSLPAGYAGILSFALGLLLVSLVVIWRMLTRR